MVGLVRRGAGREEGDAARHAALGQRLLGRGRGGNRGGDAGDDFDFDAGRFQRAQFFVGAPEQHRIAAFQAHHLPELAGAFDQLLVDDGLRRGALARALADGDQLRLAAQGQHLGRDEGVVEHDVGLLQQARAAYGDEVGGTGSGSYQIDFPQCRHTLPSLIDPDGSYLLRRSGG